LAIASVVIAEEIRAGLGDLMGVYLEIRSFPWPRAHACRRAAWAAGCEQEPAAAGLPPKPQVPVMNFCGSACRSFEDESRGPSRDLCPDWGFFLAQIAANGFEARNPTICQRGARASPP